jgi:hypothetical protein
MPGTDALEHGVYLGIAVIVYELLLAVSQHIVVLIPLAQVLAHIGLGAYNHFLI